MEPHYSEPPGSEPSFGQKLKKLFGPIGVALVVIAKFAAKIKFLLLPLFKFLPILLKTGGTMVLSVGVYAMSWGWKFALGFVLLLFVHECGHLLVARKFGLNVGAPVFIPFMGAFIALKDAPKDAWMEAWVGIGGPLLGTLGAAVCAAIFRSDPWPQIHNGGVIFWADHLSAVWNEVEPHRAKGRVLNRGSTVQNANHHGEAVPNLAIAACLKAQAPGCPALETSRAGPAIS
jgi:hypothetical protein